MKKIIGAVLCVVALVGCGGPLEGDGTDVGTSQQALLNADGVAAPPGTLPTINQNAVRNPQEAVVRVQAFQELQHVTDPLHANPCH